MWRHPSLHDDIAANLSRRQITSICAVVEVFFSLLCFVLFLFPMRSKSGFQRLFTHTSGLSCEQRETKFKFLQVVHHSPSYVYTNQTRLKGTLMLQLSQLSMRFQTIIDVS